MSQSIGSVANDALAYEVGLSQVQPTDGYVLDNPPYVTYNRMTGTYFGTVAKDYPLMQPEDVLMLAYDADDSVTAEQVYKVGDGKVFGINLKMNSFTLQDGDDYVDYLYLWHGYDGKTPLGVTGTNLRVVCSNTHNTAVSAKSTIKRKVIHRGNWDGKVANLREHLASLREQSKTFQNTITNLNGTEITNDSIRGFYRIAWQALGNKAVAYDPTTEAEAKNASEFNLASFRWNDILEREVDAGLKPSAWLMINSVTNDVQHRQGTRGRKADPDNRAMDNVIGKRADLTNSILELGEMYV